MKLPEHISFGQLLLLGLLFILGLRLFSGLLWSVVIMLEPLANRWVAQVSGVVPLPFLVLLTPFLLAGIIIYWLTRTRGIELFGAHQDKPLIRPQSGAGDRLLNPTFTVNNVMTILKLITLIWLVVWITRVIFWLAFRSYAPGG